MFRIGIVIVLAILSCHSYKIVANDNDSLNHYLTLAKSSGSEYLQADYYLNKALSFVNDKADSKVVVELYYDLSSLYNRNGSSYGIAIDYAMRALSLMEEESLSIGVLKGKIYHSLALSYTNLRSWDEGLDWALKAKRIYQEFSEKRNLVLATNISAICFSQMREYDKALNTYLEILNWNFVDLENLARINNNIGQLYFAQYEDSLALSHYKKAVYISKAQDNPNRSLLMLACVNVAGTSWELKNYVDARFFFQEMYDIVSQAYEFDSNFYRHIRLARGNLMVMNKELLNKAVIVNRNQGDLCSTTQTESSSKIIIALLSIFGIWFFAVYARSN